MLRSCIGLIGSLLLAGLVISGGCSKSETKKTTDPGIENPLARKGAKLPPPSLKFTDITKKAGIAFRHTSGARGKKLLPETLGSGVAFLDYDNDGRQDLLFINSCQWPGDEDKSKPTPTMALYRNKGDGTFEDVTTAAGLNVTFYGLGVTVGDCDNDGWVDVFITGVGGNYLFRNVAGGKGSRRFEDVTKKAGDLTQTWNWPTAKGDAFLKWNQPVSFGSSTAFLDYDLDGKLDLFVCNYVTWSPHFDLTQGFTLAGIGRAYGPPKTFEGAHCLLYRNKGDGTFENVSRKAGIEVTGLRGEAVAKALGVIVCDPDDDGWPDIVVANDTVRNFLFHNQRDGTFREIGQEAGVAYAEALARGAMGIDWGEYRPGKCALLIGNFAGEPDTFLRLDDPKQLLFSDVALFEGIAGPSRVPLVFGVMFFDYDLDGRLDFLTANGHLEPEIHTVSSYTYKQEPQLFWNTGDQPAYELVTKAQAGADLFAPIVGRGCAYGDVDDDGDLDVVLTENGGPARLLRNDLPRNDGGTKHNWVRFVLEGDGKRINRSAIGARVKLKAAGVEQRREICAARGYLSQSELAVTFGLAKTNKIERVEIHWPGRDLRPLILENVQANKTHRIVQK